MTVDVTVLDTTYPDLAIEKDVLDGFNVVRVDGATPDDVREAGRGRVIITGARARFDAAAIADLGCEAIIRAGIGVETVDLAAATEHGITVCNVPHYGTESVAQHALAMALAANRRLTEADQQVRERQWGFRSLRPMRVPAAQTAGVLGLGHIGTRTAELFAAVGFGRVIGSDPYVTDHAIENVELDELLSSADVISLHVPGNKDGSAVIGEAEIALMRPDSVIVNTARGSLIDDTALATGLQNGRPRVAALDVFDVEPPDLTPFAGVEERLLLSPHQAWYTEESQASLRRQSAEEALRILRGEAPLNQLGTP